MKTKYKNLSKISSGLVLTSAAVGVNAQTAPAKQKAAANTPNVLYILCDDLGFADIEVYGNQHIATPNLNRLAKSGMSFTQFYAGTSVSAPSRASLMTGQHTGHTKVRGNYEISPEGQMALDPAVKIIPELFKSAGYTTGAFGKWGMGYPGSGGEPNDRGVDVFYGHNCQRYAHRYYPDHLWNNKTKVIMNGTQYSQDSIHQHALSFIRDNKDKPFFGYIAYTLPHAELKQPSDSILQKYNGKFYESSSYSGGTSYESYSSTNIPRTQFAGMVTRMDTYVGELLAELEKQGVLENTMIIFTSDNGPHVEGGADPTFFNTEKRLRGTKRYLYEGGMREPFIVSWKGHVPEGTVNNFMGVAYDMLPTFTELLGKQATWTQATDGISMLPTITGQGTQAEHDYLYWEFHEDGGRQAVRKGNWKLIRQNISSTPTLELYDLDTDLAETTNLATKYPDKVQELLTLINSAHTPSTVSGFKFPGE